ncbi:alpha-hydroxy acid oxidase [Streptomyces sp. Edi2]|uniref:alpha-hydroxy acid oxidase n=1 Tax=Streptomyces sp. Edi2 TaxID=3162528 RepID=UPI003306466C
MSSTGAGPGVTPPWTRVTEAEQAARDRLPADIWDFVAGGSGDESVLTGNLTELNRITVVPRVLNGQPGGVRLARQLGRSETRMPVVIAPMAYQRLVHPQGELAVAEAARAEGIPYVVPMLSSHPLEKIADVGATLWFQLYWLRDRGVLLDLVRRAEQAGCRAIVITVDVPVMARRPRDLRNGFALPADVTAGNLDDTGPTTHTRVPGASAVATHSAVAFDPAACWSDLEWLRAQTELPLVVKGILDPRDAVRAAERGADTVVVSNHGGRQLPAAVPSCAALPPVVERLAGRCEVLLDGGVRTGADVLRALALGADGVMYGRPVLWGLAADGGAGVRTVLGLLRTETEEALLLSGCADLAAVRQLTVARTVA